MRRSRAYSDDTEAFCPRARCRSSRAAFRQGSGRHRWSDQIESRCVRRYRHLASTFFLEHGDMWRGALLLDQPVQHRSSPVRGIPDKPLWLETKALLCSFDHCPRRSDLGLANGAGRLDINDDAELYVDEIIVGVSEECWSLVSSGPLGRGIGQRDELRHNVAGRAPGRRRDPCQHNGITLAGSSQLTFATNSGPIGRIIIAECLSNRPDIAPLFRARRTQATVLTTALQNASYCLPDGQGDRYGLGSSAASADCAGYPLLHRSRMTSRR